MSLIILGINHKTAPVSVREKAAFAEHELAQAMADLRLWLNKSLNEKLSGEFETGSQVAILSTCNRVELFVMAEGCEPEMVEELVSQWLLIRIQQSHSSEDTSDSKFALKPFLYSYYQKSAVNHIMRVASGLDSMVLGEPQILGQLKATYQKAQRAGTLGRELDRLFQKSFSAAKKVRHDTEIGANAVSVAFAAVNLAKHIFADFTKLTVMFVGAGETIELAAKHLQQHQVGHMIMANRTLANGQKLAQDFDGLAIGLEAIPHHFPQADIVISSTGSMLPIIGKGMVEKALKERGRKSIFMVDLAVPRDIETSVGDLDDVYLYTVDDLEGVIQDNMQARQEAAEEAQSIIVPFVDGYMDWLKSLKKHDTVRELQHKYQQIAQLELQRAKSQLKNNETAEDALEALTHRLLKKFLHQPLVWLRQDDVQSAKKIELKVDNHQMMRQLFDLDDANESHEEE